MITRNPETGAFTIELETIEDRSVINTFATAQEAVESLMGSVVKMVRFAHLLASVGDMRVVPYVSVRTRVLLKTVEGVLEMERMSKP